MHVIERWARLAVRQHLGLLAVLLITLGVTLGYSLLNPLGEAPDELAHVDLIRFISREGHLPQTAEERQEANYKADKPMLYHALIGFATGWVDINALPALKVNGGTPRRMLIDDWLSPFVLIRTQDELPPYRGAVLLWRLARLASSLFSAGTLVVVYLIGLAIWPGRRDLALGITAVTAAIPQFHWLASTAQDDNLLGLLAALFTLTLLKVAQQPCRRLAYVGLGGWLGLALTTKYSVGLLPLLVVVMLAGAVRRGQLGGRAALGRFALFGTSLTLTAGWWFVYVERYFNQVSQLGLVAGLLKPLMAAGADISLRRVAAAITGGVAATDVVPPTHGSLWEWMTTMFRTFWLTTGQANPSLSTGLYAALLALSLLAVAGLVCRLLAARREAATIASDKSHAKPQRALSFTNIFAPLRLGVRYCLEQRSHLSLPWSTLGLLAVQILLLVPFPLLRFYLTHNPAETGQGRHVLFPAAATIGVLLTVGVLSWFPRCQPRRTAAGLAGGLLAVSLASFGGTMLPSFPDRLPVRTASDAAVDAPNPVHVQLDPAIELVGYQVGEANPYGALPVALIWRSRSYADQNYLVDLSLLDGAGGVCSRWLGYPVNGHYPTLAWEPRDVVRDQLWLPLAGCQAGDYRLMLRLRPGAPPNPPLAPPIPASFTMPVVHLDPPGPAPYPEQPFVVWQSGQPAGSAPRFGYRASITLTDQGALQSAVALVGPDGVARPPQLQAGRNYIFVVGPDWQSGAYRVQTGGASSQVETQPFLTVQVRPRTFDVPPLASPVKADFGDDVTLLGYDLPERRVSPGGALPIIMYWQARRATLRHYIVFNHLLNSADLRQWGGGDRVPENHYSTVLWTPGEVVRDEYLVPVDPAAPPGVYRLDVGLYVELAGQPHSVPLVKDGAVLDVTSVTIAPIKVGGPPPGVTVEQPAPQHPRADDLGGQVTLIGYDLSSQADALTLTLYWRCRSRLASDYTTFVHVRQITGQPGQVVAQMDRPPAEGAYPTSLWDAGEVIRDAVRVPPSRRSCRRVSMRSWWGCMTPPPARACRWPARPTTASH